MDEMGNWAGLAGSMRTADELRVSAPVRAWLADQFADHKPGAAGVTGAPAPSFLSVPVVVDDRLTGGQWVVMAGGEAEASGDVAPPSGPDWHVDYVRGAGWIEANMAVLDRMVFGGEGDGC